MSKDEDCRTGAGKSSGNEGGGGKVHELYELFNAHETTIGDWSAYVTSEYIEQKCEALTIDDQPEQRDQTDVSAEHRPSESYELLVSNINYASTEQDLLLFFGGTLLVEKVTLHKHKTTNSSTGRGNVMFKSADGMARGFRMNGEILNGRSLRVTRGSCYARYDTAQGDYDSFNDAGYASTFPRRRQDYRSNHGGINLRRHNYSHYNENSSQNLMNYNSKHNFHPYNNFYANRQGMPRATTSSGYSGGYRAYNHDSQPGGCNQSAPYVHSSSYGNHKREPTDNYTDLRSYPSQEIYGTDRRSSGARAPDVPQADYSGRPRLVLQQRTKPKYDELPIRPKSIFGDAKPVDTTAVERRAEEKIRMEDEALRKKREDSSRKVSVSSTSAPNVAENKAIHVQSYHQDVRIQPHHDARLQPRSYHDGAGASRSTVSDMRHSVGEPRFSSRCNPSQTDSYIPEVMKKIPSYSAHESTSHNVCPSTLGSRDNKQIHAQCISEHASAADNRVSGSVQLPSNVSKSSRKSYRTFTRSRDLGNGRLSTGRSCDLKNGPFPAGDTSRREEEWEKERVNALKGDNHSMNSRKRATDNFRRQDEQRMNIAYRGRIAPNRKVTESSNFSEKSKKTNQVSQNAKLSSKYIEVEPVSFSSSNKFEYLAETDE